MTKTDRERMKRAVDTLCIELEQDARPIDEILKGGEGNAQGNAIEALQQGRSSM